MCIKSVNNISLFIIKIIFMESKCTQPVYRFDMTIAVDWDVKPKTKTNSTCCWRQRLQTLTF